MRYEYVVDAGSDGMSLGAFLRRRAGLSLSLVRTLKMAENGITVDGAAAHTDARLAAGQLVAVQAPEKEELLAPCFESVAVLYEDRDAIVYDKPAGMAVHPTLGYPEGTLANVYAARLLALSQRGCFRPINRLDRNTSGAVLAAKSRLAAPALASGARKIYAAVAEGAVGPDEFIIDSPIGLEDGSFIKRCVRQGGQASATAVRVIARAGGCTLLDARTLTGRTHQIRVHLASIGHPLAGDDLYGGSRALMARHALHCRCVSFTDLAGGEVAVRSPLSADMLELLAALGTTAPEEWL